MDIEIENPFELLLESAYINGMLNSRETPEFKNLNKLINDIKTKLDKNE